MRKNIVLDNLNDPEILENSFRTEPEKFKNDFSEAFSHIQDSETLKVWGARLNYLPKIKAPKITLIFLISVCALASLIAKIPAIFEVSTSWFYPRFIPLIILSAIASYFLKTNLDNKNKKLIIGGIFLGVTYLMVIPEIKGSTSIVMALIHLPLIFLSLLALSFMSNEWKEAKSRIKFVRYIGETGIYSVLIVLGGIVLTGVTFGLFALIGLTFEEWFIQYVVFSGLISAPIVATYLYDVVQNREGKFASILSNVFAPLFLIIIVSYILATFYQGKSPHTDRDFLIIFNGLLILILAMTIFSIAGKKTSSSIQLTDYINVALICSTLIIDMIALFSIILRWSEFGVTINRVVVTGANLVIFVHLVLMLRQYYGFVLNKFDFKNVELAVVKYFPVYTAWSIFVSVVLPIMVGFK